MTNPADSTSRASLASAGARRNPVRSPVSRNAAQRPRRPAPVRSCPRDAAPTSLGIVAHLAMAEYGLCLFRQPAAASRSTWN
jgi:hypothetical protein